MRTVTRMMNWLNSNISIKVDIQRVFRRITNANILIGMSDKGKENATANQLAGLSISTKSPSPPRPPRQPPRPAPQPEPEEDEDDFEEEDENDPFADRNAVVTPKVEKKEPVWSVSEQGI